MSDSRDMAACSIPACEKPVDTRRGGGRGLCAGHYKQVRREERGESADVKLRTSSKLRAYGSGIEAAVNVRLPLGGWRVLQTVADVEGVERVEVLRRRLTAWLADTKNGALNRVVQKTVGNPTAEPADEERTDTVRVAMTSDLKRALVQAAKRLNASESQVLRAVVRAAMR